MPAIIRFRSGFPTVRGRISAAACLTILALLAGCQKATPISTNEPPTAAAAASPTSGPAPLTVTFTGTGTDPDGLWMAYIWDFGDGTSFKQKDAEHTYPTAGSYTATLTVIDGNLAETKDTVIIAVGQTANQPPTATISANPMSGTVPLQVGFSGSGSDPDGTIVSYSWAFGDGTSSTQQVTTHTYQSAGTYAARLTVTDNGGATGSATVTITVSTPSNRPPTATASANPTSGVAPLVVSFTGSGSDPDGTIASYAWTFGDGTTSSVRNPSHTYSSAGNYTATLTVTDNNGAAGSATVNITVATNRAPSVTVAATPMSGRAPLAVSFTGSATDPDGTIASYSWTFGDGGTSTLQNPSHTYQSAGNYTATLTVTDNLGARGTATVGIVVSPPANQPPTASASANPTSGAAPLAVSFTGSGSDPDGTIASYAWSFGDATTSSLQNPSHTYQSAGNYAATLTVTDNAGATGTASVAITVGTNRPPTATASATPTTGTAPLAVSFTGSATDTDGTIASYAWTFGDGTTSTQQNVSHTYQTAGTYTATMTATDNAGARGSASVTITVNPPANRPPTASASANPISGAAPLTVSFTGSGSDPDGTIASYAWTFGDATTSLLQNPSHTYQSAETYTATLTVTDNSGATGTASVTITVRVNQAPTATASATPTSGPAPLAVSFTGTGTDSDGTITSYAWAFGDGGTSTLQNPSRTYQTAGSYTATLTVTDNGGAQGSATVAITVQQGNRPPIANAGADQTNRDPGATITLNGTASLDPDGGTLTYQWTQTAGTAVTLTGANTATPSFVTPLRITATYTFTLAVTDNGSPAASAQDTVNVSTRVTYVNTIRSLYSDRGFQSNGTELGCVQCHAPGKSESGTPLTTYSEAFNWRSKTRSLVSTGGSMRKYLLTGEPDVVIKWIDAGAPETN